MLLVTFTKINKLNSMPAPVIIQSIGTAVPPFKIFQEKHLSILENANGMSREEKLQLRKIYSRSGIDSRYSVLEEFGKDDQPGNFIFHPSNHHPSMPVSERMKLYEQHAPDLCVSAIENCLNNFASPLKNQITHLVTFSCTGMFAPGLDIQLVEKLGLERNVERICINFMGCYAGINALKSAYHIIRSQPEAIVLLAGVELCTLHYQKNDKQDQLIANALFSDGASACIVSSESLPTKGNSQQLLLQNFYSEFEPAGANEMVWRIGDFGFDLKLTTHVPDLIKNSIHALSEKLFDKAKIKRVDIDYFALHPGGMKILEACEEALSITKDQNKISYQVLKQYGNMSAVTIFFVLNDYLKSFSRIDEGKKILACAFGPGLTMESMIAEIC